MVNEDMPFFRQFPNVCGSTSLLMVLKPVSRSIDKLINYGWEKGGKMFKANPRETQVLPSMCKGNRFNDVVYNFNNKILFCYSGVEE